MTKKGNNLPFFAKISSLNLDKTLLKSQKNCRTWFILVVSFVLRIGTQLCNNLLRDQQLLPSLETYKIIFLVLSYLYLYKYFFSNSNFIQSINIFLLYDTDWCFKSLYISLYIKAIYHAI